eukprot:TRINITY_DN59925_c0_g1_i1.p1 TRINITY_DN59925_c0_g1~~TRINITY_DN59925_c0_g1_i1.p1  ORF type:complete len:602 (-),score=65.29 TRINITY_DN59925_c0_g1_i1:91-1839(-)
MVYNMWPRSHSLLCCLHFVVGHVRSSQKNIVLIVADDLRPELNLAYGQKHVLTPNLDRLAQDSLIFDRAYTNFAICSPSRNSFMTGRLPDKTQVWNFIQNFRHSRWGGDSWLTLPEFFKHQNYTVLGAGKLFHPGQPPNWDLPRSWSADRPYATPKNDKCQTEAELGASHQGPYVAICTEDAKDPSGIHPFDTSKFEDFRMAQAAVDDLHYLVRRRADTGNPFFLALGFHYPHLPWHVPINFINHYRSLEELPLPRFPFSPKGVPDVAFTAELDGRTQVTVPGNWSQGTCSAANCTFDLPTPKNNTIPDWAARELRIGYYSAVSLMDYCVGFLLDALNMSGAANDTLVVFFGDHGYQLGEHTIWGKHTNFEQATHVPLLMRAPWLSGGQGGKHVSSSFVELVDLYRTLASLAGVPEPAADVDGTNFSGIFENHSAVISSVSYSQYPRCPHEGKPMWYLNNCEYVTGSNITVMGYSVRSKSWRYTEWLTWDGTRCEALWDQPVAVELYSHEQESTFPLDLDGTENENFAFSPDAQHQDARATHHELLKRRFDVSNPHGCPTPEQSTRAQGAPLLWDADLDIYV